MPKFNFTKTLEEANEKYDLGKGQSWKPKEGANRIRLMSECVGHQSVYEGNTTFKWMCHILDRKTNKVELYFMPNKIYKQIETFQLDPDYAFDEVPMPYDITLNVVNAGKMDVVYTVIPSPKRTEVTAEELEMLNAKKSIHEVKAKLEANDYEKMDEVSKKVMEQIESGEMPVVTPDEFVTLHPIVKEAMQELKRAQARQARSDQDIPIVEGGKEVDLKDIPF